MTLSFPTRLLRPTPLRIATVSLCLMLGGCTVAGDWFGSDRADYKSGSKRTQPLEVPPDLTQLQPDTRYLPQGGVVTASGLSRPEDAAAAPAGAASVPTDSMVAARAIGNAHLVHSGDRRWLATKEAPEAVLPKVRAYLAEQGFKLTEDDPKTGILQTDWVENKSTLPGDTLHRFLGKWISSFNDSGLRDRYRFRLERSADNGTEIYVTHFGATEEVTGFQKSEVQWVPRPSDPGLEAQQLSGLLLALGGVQDSNLAAVKQPSLFGDDDDEAASAPKRAIPSALTQQPVDGGSGQNGAMRAHLVAGQPAATMVVDDNFDRAWRRVGLALDHGGFTVEDRDRAQGLYYVRYVDAKAAAKDEPGFLSKISSWFGNSGPSPVGKYRISIKSGGDTSTVTVQNDQGQPDNSDNARRIVSLLVDELK
ncbi:MAG TPA: outer membrane protein assembly factor BamC [Burkholderiaceae bacterium]